MKKIFTIFLILCFFIFVGCTNKKNTLLEIKEKNNLIEQSIDLPNNTELLCDVETSGKNLQILTYDSQKNSISIYNKNKPWNQIMTYNTPSNVIYASFGVEGVIVGYVDDNNTRYQYITKNGNHTLIDSLENQIIVYQKNSSNGEFLFTQDNKLFLIKHGEAKYIKEYDGIIDSVCIVNSKIFLLKENKLFVDNLTNELTLSEKKKISNKLVNYKIPTTQSKMVIDDNYSINLLNRQGIYNITNSNLEYQINSSHTRFGDINSSVDKITIDSRKNLYVIVDVNGKKELYKYKKGKKSNIKTKITVVSLNDNPSLEQSIYMYQRKNPDLKIDWQNISNSVNGTQLSDTIRMFNTKILSSSDIDVIMLDGLPIDKYIKNGLLYDMSDNIKMDNSSLFTGITNTYFQKNKLYAVPTRFSLMASMGRGNFNELNDDKFDFDNLKTDAHTLIPLSEILYYKIFYDKKNYTKKNIELYIDLMNKIDSKSGDESSEFRKSLQTIFVQPISSQTFEQLFDSKLNFAADFVDSSLTLRTMTALNQIGIKFSFLNKNNSVLYFPMVNMGISSKSKNKEAAAKFINYMLDEECQSSYLYQLAVNRNALEKQLTDLGKIEYDYAAANPIVVSSVEGNIKSNLLNILTGKLTKIDNNTSYKQLIFSEVQKYLNKEISKKECTNRIIEKIKLLDLDK